MVRKQYEISFFLNLFVLNISLQLKIDYQCRNCAQWPFIFRKSPHTTYEIINAACTELRHNKDNKSNDKWYVIEVAGTGECTQVHKHTIDISLMIVLEGIGLRALRVSPSQIITAQSDESLQQSLRICHTECWSPLAHTPEDEEPPPNDLGSVFW